MSCPPAVGRSLLRLGAGVLVLGLLVAVGGALLARQQLGRTADDTRRLAQAEVQARVSAITRALDAAVLDASRGGADVEQAAAGASDAIGRLFDRVTAMEAATAPVVIGLTIYGPDGGALAWSGRPSMVPLSRLSGGASVFLIPTSLGHRLARVEPIHLPDGGRRVGSAVAEAALSESGAALSPTQAPAVIETRLASAVLDPTPDLAEPSSFVVTTAEGAVLGRATLSPEVIEDARAQWWTTITALLWLIGAAGLLLTSGPLADWRAASRRLAGYTGLSLAIALVALGALAASDRALDAARLDAAPGLRFLSRGLYALGLAWLLATVVQRWRVTSRTRRSPRRTWRAPAILAAAAVPVGMLLARYGDLVASALPYGWADVARVSLIPFDAGHVSAAAGLIVAQAAAFALIVTWLGVAVLALGARDGRRGWPRTLAVAAGLVLGVLLARPSDGRSWPALVAACGVLLMWLAVSPSRRLLTRGSQPARVLVLGLALVLPSIALYPSLATGSAAGRTAAIEQVIAGQVANQRRDLQQFLREALGELDAAGDLVDLVNAAAPPPAGVPVGVDAAFHAWSQTVLSARRLTSSVELYDGRGRLVSRFALNLPETSVDQAWRETTCSWELFEEVSPFFAEERRLLHAGRGLCVTGADGRQAIVGSVVVHVVLDYGNLPFLAAQNPYVDLLRPAEPDPQTAAWRDALSFVVYGWSRRPLFVSGRDAWPLSDQLFARIASSRDRFWTTIEDRGERSDVYLLNDRGAIYAVGYPRTPLLGHLAAVAEIVALAAVIFVVLLAAVVGGAAVGGRAPVSGRALLRDVRTSFSRTLFLAFVAAVVMAVVALALVTRAYMATILRADVEQEATRTALSASRVVEDFGTVEARGASGLPVLDDSLLVWLSRVVGEDINVFAGTGLLASSERNLFASGLLPTRTPAAIYRALALAGRPTAVTRERVGDYEYLVASAPVRLDDRQAIVSVPITTRQREIERQLDELDRRVLLAAIAFILFGSIVGYRAAERISDPVSRLTRATRRLAAGDLDARLLVRSSDELGRLVEAFNGMADDLQRQRGQLERTNRLEAWAEMARQVAHDIKNPLTPIQLNAEHLRRVHVDRGRPLGPVVDECIANILLQVRLLRQLAAEFSSFASSPQARPEPTSLGPLFDEILAPYQLALAGRIQVTHAVAPGLPPALVDRVLLARALTNVVENALHAMPGEGTLRVSAALDEAGAIAIVVADTGVGMDAAALARIFEPYFSTKATGTGLGLTIARRNVELNGGRIAVASTQGVGTQVTLRVPAAADQSTAESEGGEASAATSATGSARLERAPASQSITGETR